MWMRIAGAIALAGFAFAVVTCGGDLLAGSDEAGAGPVAATPTPSSSGSATASRGDAYTIACALGGAATFESTCTVEQREIDGVKLLAVFHPDGGFRRFEVLSEGAGLAAVAGADAVSQTLEGDTLEIALAGHRYRFPAAAR